LSSRKFFFTTIILALTAVASNAQTIDFQSALMRGDASVDKEQYKAAIEEYSKVTSGASELYARATYNIGVCHYELWQTDEAIVFYRRAIELKGGNYPRASYALGVALEGQGQLSEAKAAYEQAANASRRGFAPALYRQGIIEAQAGNFQRAAALFKEAAAQKGAHVPASHNNLGVMLARLGFLKEAEQEFVIALKTSNGQLNDAAHNLNLCRSLTTQIPRDQTILKLSLN